jgi:hypothetical protein
MVHRLVEADSLVGIHMNDLGIINNQDLALEILDSFDVERSKLTSSSANIEKRVNKNVKNTDAIKKELAKMNESLNSQQINKSSRTQIDTVDYKNYLIKAKQKKQLQ